MSIHQHRREADEVLARAQQVLTLATEQGFAQTVAVGTRDRGWALSMHGHLAEGIALMRQGHAAFQATGGARAYPFVWLAEALGKAGEADAGLHILAEGLALVEQHEERVYEAELHRLKGALLLSQASPIEEAEACFHRALDVARRPEAKSLELRAAMSLARLWQQQGKRTEAYDLLAPIYGWFTEGFDTADLQDARALLEALA
jgi:predicted ATPase